MTDMERRGFIKLAGLGAGVTAVGLVVPLGESATTADWISTSSKPARFVRRLPLPQLLAPVPMTDQHGDVPPLRDHPARRVGAGPRPGFAPHSGPRLRLRCCRAHGARPPDQGGPEHARQDAGPQRAADHAPDVRLRGRRDVGAPPRLGLAAAVRRVRRRRDPARPGQGLLVPEPPGRQDDLVPRPQRPPHGPEHLQRSARAVPHPERLGEGEPAPGQVRRPDDRSATRCSPRTASSPTWTGTTPACGET